jgi:hypothetical protein
MDKEVRGTKLLSWRKAPGLEGGKITYNHTHMLHITRLWLACPPRCKGYWLEYQMKTTHSRIARIPLTILFYLSCAPWNPDRITRIFFLLCFCDSFFYLSRAPWNPDRITRICFYHVFLPLPCPLKPWSHNPHLGSRALCKRWATCLVWFRTS